MVGQMRDDWMEEKMKVWKNKEYGRRGWHLLCFFFTF